MSRFDEIESYDEEIPFHVMQHLLVKKTDMMLRKIRAEGLDIGRIRVLDLGCGTGRYLARLYEKGIRNIKGIDLSHKQIELARENNAGNNVKLLQGDVLNLPFATDSFEVAYTINCLHHLESWERQLQVFEELKRVLTPGGILFVHEISTQNPAIRFYLDNIFPKIRSIDDGTELWLPADLWRDLDGLKLVDLQCFTFVPDFTPLWLLPLAKLAESVLEGTSLREFGAHYMVMLKRI